MMQENGTAIDWAFFILSWVTAILLLLPFAGIILLTILERIFTHSDWAVVQRRVQWVVRFFEGALVLSVLVLLCDYLFIRANGLSSSILLSDGFLWGPLWHLGSYQFLLQSLVDPIALLFGLMTIYLSALVGSYARVYLHRDSGFLRFFRAMFLFQGGMLWISFSGNLSVFFMGWEWVGLASYLLIGFYRERERPREAAFEVFSIYRIADIGLLVGAILAHVEFHEAQDFLALQSASFAEAIGTALVSSHQGVYVYALGGLLVLCAAGKSAQFPFSHWVAQAMEGPTPSSAIFYGALSIHAGVLLLLRTAPIWGAIPPIVGIVGALGALTALLAAGIGRVQTSIKTQIGYASVAQVGLIFIELALGLHAVALIHFVLNACLRCYQLLVSPSIVSIQLRAQAQGQPVGHDNKKRLEKKLPAHWQGRIYAWLVEEGHLPDLLETLLWSPLLKVAQNASWLVSLLMGFLFYQWGGEILSSVCLGASMFFVLTAWAQAHDLSARAERANRRSLLHKSLFTWSAAFMGPIALFVSVARAVIVQYRQRGAEGVETLKLLTNAHLAFFFCLGTLAVSLVIGLLLLRTSVVKERSFDRTYCLALPSCTFQLLFFLALAGVSAPVSAVFFGEDALLYYGFAIGAEWLFVIPFVFVMTGLSLMKQMSEFQVIERAGCPTQNSMN